VIVSARETGSGLQLTAFFPAFNDAPSLPELVRRFVETARDCAAEFEVIAVNDGSTDATAEVLSQLEREYAPHLRVITHPRNLGYGAALRSGFQAATKELVFYTDGDGQYDPRELRNLVALLAPGIGLVNGYKLRRHDPWHRVVIGEIYRRFARLVFRIRIRDIDCDFRLVRRSLVENLHLRSTSGTICVELVRKIEMSGCGVAECGVHHYPRLYGRSQFFRWRSLLTTFRQMLGLWWELVAVPFFRRRPTTPHADSDSYRQPETRPAGD
jgi:glycosyltransferase involved in cell wall biosynthesis